jgi:hypothetical protein
LTGLRAAQAQGRRDGCPRTVDDDVLAIVRGAQDRMHDEAVSGLAG